MGNGDKQADLAGPGVSTYEEVAKILPDDYEPLQPPMERMEALFLIKDYIEKNLCKELNLKMVQVPLIVDLESGVNDYLDRDGSRTPVQFPCGLGLQQPIQAQVVQAATKWKRMALKQFGCKVGEGVCTDMKAVRKDYFLDHDHSAYVDQWDWERAITEKDRNLDFLKDVVKKIWKVLYGASQHAQEQFPALQTSKYPDIPEELQFFHAEEILDRYPDLPRKQRETKMIQEVAPAIFIIGIGWVLKDGYPHEMRAADYDDWAVETIEKDGLDLHGYSGNQRDTESSTEDIRSGGFPQASVSPGHSQRRDPTVHWRRHRAITHLHVPAAHSPHRRGQCYGLAQRAQRYLRGQEHPGAGIENLVVLLLHQ
jgi:aspartate--ammonia ligase